MRGFPTALVLIATVAGCEQSDSSVPSGPRTTGASRPSLAKPPEPPSPCAGHAVELHITGSQQGGRWRLECADSLALLRWAHYGSRQWLDWPRVDSHPLEAAAWSAMWAHIARTRWRSLYDECDGEGDESWRIRFDITTAEGSRRFECHGRVLPEPFAGIAHAVISALPVPARPGAELGITSTGRSARTPPRERRETCKGMSAILERTDKHSSTVIEASCRHRVPSVRAEYSSSPDYHEKTRRRRVDAAVWKDFWDRADALRWRSWFDCPDPTVPKNPYGGVWLTLNDGIGSRSFRCRARLDAPDPYAELGRAIEAMYSQYR